MATTGNDRRLPKGIEKMAPAEKCPSCRQVMYANQERYQPAGTEVVYVCRYDLCPTYVKSGRRHREQLKKFVDNRR